MRRSLQGVICMSRRNQAEERKHFHFDNLYFGEPQQYESISLYQIGDLSCKGGYETGNHEQMCYEISYIVSGEGTCTIGNTVQPVREGDIVLNVPGERHNLRADDVNPFRFYYVGFLFAEAQEGEHSFLHIQRMFDQTSPRVVPNKLGIEAPFISIFNELLQLKSYAPTMIGAYLRQLIIIAYRSFHENWAKRYSPTALAEASGMSPMIYEVINYIDVNLHRIREMPQIAEELHYSYSHMSHSFSREVGLTMKEYYDRKRFEQAVEWLQEGEWTVTQIAEKLGYKSIHTFSRAFRHNFGISPTQYQALSAKNVQQEGELG